MCKKKEKGVLWKGEKNNLMQCNTIFSPVSHENIAIKGSLSHTSSSSKFDSLGNLKRKWGDKLYGVSH